VASDEKRSDRKRSRGRGAPAKEQPTTKRGARSRKARGDGGKRAALAIREAIGAALGQDRELMEEVGARSGDKARPEARVFIQAAGALEPVLADAVKRRPSFLGRLAYGTAQLVSTLASEDASSGPRLAEMASGSHVGIVFVDVVGFTAFTSANGDEAAVELVRRLETLVSGVCRRHEGEVVKHLGDGFLLAFPSASRAVRAALALRDAARKARERDPSFQRVRIAVHAGRPSFVRDDLIGHDVNLTARLLEHCDPGEIVVTEEAKLLAERRLRSLRFSSAGSVKLRGVPEPVGTYRVEPMQGKEAERPAANTPERR
jgi:class 3 adenylate cyclase